MESNRVLSIYIGYDSREAVCSDVLKHSISKRTNSPLKIEYLKHRDLRAKGLFKRKWSVDALTGEWIDDNDTKKFSTEFSHTRFLVPALMEYKGWALFCDSDMIFLSDIQKLFNHADDKYALMCVKHQHKPKPGAVKMDGRQQLSYNRKNWSSFVLFNCSHPSNKKLTPAEVGFMTGGDLHAFTWLKDYEIGELPFDYNYIPGVSPRRGMTDGMPAVIHYTDGGPWFEECQDVAYAGTWLEEYEDHQKNGHGSITDVPTTRYDEMEDVR